MYDMKIITKTQVAKTRSTENPMLNFGHVFDK